jgi:hypothetical protein
MFVFGSIFHTGEKTCSLYLSESGRHGLKSFPNDFKGGAVEGGAKFICDMQE